MAGWRREPGPPQGRGGRYLVAGVLVQHPGYVGLLAVCCNERQR